MLENITSNCSFAALSSCEICPSVFSCKRNDLQKDVLVTVVATHFTFIANNALFDSVTHCKDPQNKRTWINIIFFIW